MVYASSKLEALTGALLAFAMMPQFKEENPPEHLRYNLSDRYKPSQQVLNWFLSGCVKPLQGSISLVEYYEQCEQEKDEVFAEVTAAWPCMEPPSGDFQDCTWYDMDGLDSDLSPLFASCYQNMELKDHLNCMESILDGKASSSPLESLNEEMTSPTNQQLPYSFAPSSQACFSRSMQMSQLISNLHRNANSMLCVTYTNELQESADHLSHDQATLEVGALTNLVELFKTYYEQSRRRYQSTLRFLAGYLGLQTTTLAKNGQADELHKEMENTGCNGWEAKSYADWLLIQNMVLQLNMGEGKSLVIILAAALVLADGEQLVSLQINQLGASVVQAILKECMCKCGILIMQPEHILSFKLLSIEKWPGDTMDIARELLQTQRWFHSHACDILDESDEILHIQNQLIYVISPQRPLEGSPTRWSTMTAQDVMDGWLLNFSGPHGIERTAVHHFITHMDIASSEVQMIQDYCGGTTMWTTLLHLRGLLASGILLFALMESQWHIDYGLVPLWTMLAVPYCAKDVPAPRAEFGHPDVAIVLTSLSYYCGGLDQEQLMLCFECLLTLDNPDQEYELWVCDCPEVPENLHQINGVNAQSLDQWDQYLLLMFSHNQSMVDFYLSQVVFLREAKQFHSNLSSCGWDLAEKREQITTAKAFLALVVEQEPEIHVILDVGAQVLELKNNEFARHWLEWKPDALGAIYFDEEDELTMLSCDRTTQSLSQSPYASRLDECIVYFDDAHTWGTSIKFLIGFHAAVTLGPKVMKDCLMQVMFFGPLDVDRNIRDATRKSNRDMIHPSDILLWAMGVMCLEIKNSAPYWAQQGRDHTLWYSAWSKFCSNETTSQELAKTWHQPDAKTLEELYVPSTPKDHWLLSVLEVDERCRKLGVSLSLDLNMNKEQEREIIHKMECEMQVERPPPATPALHQVSTDVRHFVHMGIVTPHWRAFVLMFNLFCNTIMPMQEENVWS
ncbi:hypothetical protein EDD17DRAFT_1509906 [Pisolithus thermaeus]|nr:hypothetical protein EV401DRAFT_2164872 [Pisolithus croceorrhizus]KAI6160811.1 hypothetical protein EDD17DRAFT_1509906 [Pisolithus thermaeus]